VTKHKHDQTVALTILEQLGGKHFRAMTGVSSLLADDAALSFKLPKNASQANKMKIRLTPARFGAIDTYEVTTYRITLPTRRNRSGENGCRLIDRQDDVYAEDLQAVFTRMTGLYTRL
jgi:hypothetical protein